MRGLIAAYLAVFGFCTLLHAAESESVKGYLLMVQGDKLMKEKKYDKALKKYLEAKAQDILGQSFGQAVDASGIVRRIGNGYALTGNAAKAINYYWLSIGNCLGIPDCDLSKVESAGNGMGATLSESRKDDVITEFGNKIKRCATCSFSLYYWEALAALYRATGDTDKAARTEAELAIHREANDAYMKEDSKGGGLGLAGTIGAVAAGINGTMPPPVTEEQTAASMAMATSKAWHAKMVVYQKHNRPEYVTQTVQEMRNSQ